MNENGKESSWFEYCVNSNLVFVFFVLSGKKKIFLLQIHRPKINNIIPVIKSIIQ